MSLQKIGLHILGSFGGDLGKPAIVKLVDPSLEYMRQVRAQVGDSCTLVVRWYEREQPLDDPVFRAREWFARRRSAMVDPLALYEGYNEIADEQAPAFAAFELERLRLMHEAGLRAAVGSWSVGVPDLPVWATYQRVLDAMTERDAIALHEYWGDAADVGNIWHVGRWRLVPQLDSKRIVVTECGRDVVEGRGFSGWKLDPACSSNAYLAELRRYGEILDAEPRILGATVFTAGQIIDARWQAYEVNSLAPLIVAENRPAQPLALARRLEHPLRWSRISQRFGENANYYKRYGLAGHNGIDLAVPDTADTFQWHGTPVLAAHEGTAVIVRDDENYGIYVYIWGSWCDTLYAHLCAATLPANGLVRAGDLIGWVGYTGNTLPVGLHGTHLHFGLRLKPYAMTNGYRGYVDPTPHIAA